MNKYYDGTKLLNMKDINKEIPEIYIVESNRSDGKTTWFSKYLVDLFLTSGKKFAILYRFNYELDDCSTKFFKDINTLFFADYDMINKSRAKGIYHELFLHNKIDDTLLHCGYAISINSADQLKKYSHLFNDIDSILFDEFQSESNHYCAMEVKKFISLHTTIARGQGKQSRYVPVYMLGNPVSLLNPYYTELEISDRLKQDTKFLRGNGFVMERHFNPYASQAQNESQFNKAFSSNKYTLYAQEGKYLNDEYAFVQKINGKSRYICTIKYLSSYYAIREFSELGVIYCDRTPDMTFPLKITTTTEDHEINYVMLKRNDYMISFLRDLFEKGCFRFKDLKCKEAILKTLSY